ncbi:hypothetical protein QBC37DRAFT_378040 [Rhypophila decipiens]|uniref:Uncharacterized protein n=1 Tax=Rhypophila decipiens TaxID=261697 RepID=A0AAN6XZA9_9PEZI|nr:hypothetical protein QBC37DRAFT_378040 [Rhypophila decipiens]
MPKAKSAAKTRRFAEEKGYIGDINNVNNNAVPRPVLPYTQGQYEILLELWDECKDDLFRKHGTVASALCLQSLKLFAEFIGNSTLGILDPSGKAAVQTVRNYFWRFVSGWNLQNPESIIPRDFHDSVTDDIKTRIKSKLGLSELTRTKTFLTLENFIYLERQLWENDPHEYVHEAYRVFISAKPKCHVYTPTRLGEISEGSTRRGTGNGLRYRDTVLLVTWKDGQPELRYSLKREFAKGLHDKPAQRPTHILYEEVPDQLLVVQPMVLAATPPEDGRQWEFEWEDTVLDYPVFPEVSADGPVWDKIQTGSSFNSQLASLSERARLREAIEVHSGRRNAILKATENGFSNDELLKFAAHTNQITRTRDYLSSICGIDGQASFLGTQLRRDMAEDFRSATVRRNPELFLSLPAQQQDEPQERPEYIEIRAELYERKRKLVRQELLNIQKTQERIHPSDSTKSFHTDQHRTRFGRLRHMMPHRSSLADLLFLNAPLRSAEGIQAINHLISLIREPSNVAYQQSLQPRQGTGLCPTPGCTEHVEEKEPGKRWSHIFTCSMAYHRNNTGLQSFVFCVATGLRLRPPGRCTAVRFCDFRHATAYDGRYATCYGKDSLPAAVRLRGYQKKAS